MMKYDKCKIKGCTNKGKLNRQGNRYFPRGFCNYHYKKWAKDNKETIEKEKVPIKNCSIDNCKNPPPYRRGMCSVHYRRLRKYGDENYVHHRNKGQTNHPLYHTYGGIKKRCLNENDKDYPNYGGKGIKICDRWLGVDGFFNFVDDMGEKPEGCTIDRINPNDDYKPSNCRWADINTQAINKNICKHKGVGLHKITGKYRARITVKGKSYSDGLFDKIEDAIKARKELELKHLGKLLNA